MRACAYRATRTEGPSFTTPSQSHGCSAVGHYPDLVLQLRAVLPRRSQATSPSHVPRGPRSASSVALTSLCCVIVVPARHPIPPPRHAGGLPPRLHAPLTVYSLCLWLHVLGSHRVKQRSCQATLRSHPRCGGTRPLRSRGRTQLCRPGPRLHGPRAQAFIPLVRFGRRRPNRYSALEGPR